MTSSNRPLDPILSHPPVLQDTPHSHISSTSGVC